MFHQSAFLSTQPSSSPDEVLFFRGKFGLGEDFFLANFDEKALCKFFKIPDKVRAVEKGADE